MTRVAMLSMHTSPFAPLGVGDGGGLNVYVRELSEALARRGVDVEVFTASSDGGAEVVDLRSRVQVHHVPLRNQHRSGVDLAAEFANCIQDRIADNDFDVLHAHYWLSGVAGHQLKHDLKIPLVSTFHTLDKVKQESGIVESETDQIRAEAEQAVIQCSDAVIASNLVEVADIRRLYEQHAPIEIVNPGIDANVFHPGDQLDARLRLGLPITAPIAVFAGRIQYAKGLDRAIEAFAQVAAMHPDAILLVIGGPSGNNGEQELDHVREIATKLHLENSVRFLGPQTQSQLVTYLQAANICVVPSRTESFGLVALEAAACAVPVVASALGGLQFIVQHGRTGFLARDIDEFAGAMDHLFSEPQKARLFGIAAAARARSFTWDHTAEQMLRIYNSVSKQEQRALADCISA